jgi:hypothetical protein
MEIRVITVLEIEIKIPKVRTFADLGMPRQSPLAKPNFSLLLSLPGSSILQALRDVNRRYFITMNQITS